MVDSVIARVTKSWQQLVERYHWQYLTDPTPLLTAVAAEISTSAVSDDKLRNKLIRSYSSYLYQGLQAEDEEAAQELWNICYNVALFRGLPLEHAYTAAQETVSRVLPRLNSIQHDSLIAYSLTALRSVIPEYYTSTQPDSLEQVLEATPQRAPVEASFTAEQVEERVLNKQILDLLRDKLPNPVERILMIRWVLLGDKPGDIARDLNIPPARARVAKYRAIARLRDDEEFMKLCTSLRDTANS